jgi:hypothetical protein
MPMDDRTKATVNALLERHPRGYAAEEAGFAVTDTAAGLFRLLCLAVLADDSVPSAAAVDATRAVVEQGWGAAPEMAKSSLSERAEALASAGYPKAQAAAGLLGEATAAVTQKYDGDLRNLREAAHGNGDRIGALLRELPGMDDAGYAVFVREAQMFWPEVAPFVDDHAARAARRLRLPDDPQALLDDIARGRGTERLSWLVGALAMVDAHDENRRIEAAVTSR